MSQRIFTIDNEHCIVHYPFRPNGFAVMIMGDVNHYVDEKSSFWMQQETRNSIISQLTEKGYIVFYSNLYGANWGSDKAVSLTQRLYHYVKRREIINEKVHILAEGMGGLIIEKLLSSMGHQIRSVVMLTPCISLYEHFSQEKEQKFFYKKLMKEITMAYNLEEQQCEDMVNAGIHAGKDLKKTDKPLYTIQSINAYRYKNQFPLINDIYIERNINRLPGEIYIILPEKKHKASYKIVSYFSLHEQL
ncbi:hydrolase [Rossellomorea vietnamensis]|uniref:Hydrolase n=1 Tax=Rossellomorea vietnamensis TaxID=218284 RepID=A0A5D4NPL8_9BACI|nr:hydrolase [Rossellomorea vietnamensis]TYS15840.1 hydrolase [Rossellomorea vietnamensis]